MNTETSPPATNGAELQLAPKRRTFQWKWLLPFMAVFLPILLLAGYSLRIATQSVETLVQEENTSAAGNLTQLLTQDVRQGVKLAHAVASIPGTVSAVKSRDELAVRTRLKAIMVSNPQLHRAFVTGTGGFLWSEFPTAQGAYGTSYGDWTWFTSVRDTKKPYISGMYIRPQYPEEPVVAIAVPILSKGEFLGVLVFEYRVKNLSDWLGNIRLGISGHMLLLDQHGSLVAHPTAPVGGALHLEYSHVSEVQQAQSGKMHTTRYIDPMINKEMVATFVPIAVGENMWVAIAQQPTEEAFFLLNQVRSNLAIAGGILTLFTLIMVIALARMSAKTVRLNKELAFKNQALKDFTSIVSHQLKAPITAMRWSLEMVLDGDYGDLTEELRKVMEGLQQINVSNYRLVMDILNVSRLDRGVVALDLKPVSVAELVERATRDYRQAAEHSGLYLKVEHEKEYMVMADLEKAAEAITNSISNALKYTKKGGITVKTHIENKSMIIEVSDTGEGMSPDMVASLFSRSGVKKTNTSAESSSGLGLYIAKQFMQMQGGDVTVASVEGKGTTFTYTLKLQD